MSLGKPQDTPRGQDSRQLICDTFPSYHRASCVPPSLPWAMHGEGGGTSPWLHTQALQVQPPWADMASPRLCPAPACEKAFGLQLAGPGLFLVMGQLRGACSSSWSSEPRIRACRGRPTLCLAPRWAAGMPVFPGNSSPPPQDREDSPLHFQGVRE